MYCTNCGHEVAANASICTNCGFKPRQMRSFCWNCGTPTTPGQAACIHCGVALGAQSGSKNKTTAGLLGIFLGSLGIHKFYLGYNKTGLIMLLVSLLTFGIGAFVMEIIALIEGIIYLSKSDEEFDELYVQNQKQWF